jgi:hypothetical protein
MLGRNRNPFQTALGQLALYQMLDLSGPLPMVHSYLISGARRTRETDGLIEEFYPIDYQTDGTLPGHLRFALRHEPLDLRIVVAALNAMGDTALAGWIRSEPTGAYSRRAWFLYETFTGRTLDVASVKVGNYIDALDSKKHLVARAINSPRHRVRDNLLGTSALCPTIRLTARLQEMIAARWDEQVRALVAHYQPETLARAVNYLYTKETRSSFAIEGEVPSHKREERFLQALHSVSAFDPSNESDLVRLQGNIVDPRYAARAWRDFQNFVGETTRQFGEYVHFICPRPEDVPGLMSGWMQMTERLLGSELDAVVVAALCAFAFVFIHPFEDGNGRIHRFLIHFVLTKRAFTPPNAIFPVSAAILRERHRYDAALEAYSRPTLTAIEWNFTEDHTLVVHNDTRDLYRFFDATTQAEYLYDRVAETIRVDFKAELDFLTVYDAAYMALRDIVDMPDRRAALLVRLCLQNGGRLSENKRKQFSELTQEEIERIQDAIIRAMQL